MATQKSQELIRKQVIAGKWRWQFPHKSGSITVTSVHVGVVTFQDSYQNPDYDRFFILSYDEFASYLAENNAKTHWTNGA